MGTLKIPRIRFATVHWFDLAIKDAELWRGGKMPEDWPWFNDRIKRMRTALDNVKEAQRFLDDLNEKQAMRQFSEAVIAEECAAMVLDIDAPWFGDPGMTADAIRAKFAVPGAEQLKGVDKAPRLAED